MQRRLVTVLSTLAIGAATMVPGIAAESQAAPAPTGAATTLLHSVPSVVASSLRLGSLNPTRQLSIALPLRLPNQHALNTFVNNEYKKNSPTYHQFVSPTTFASLFGAPATEISTVTRTLQSLGLKVSAPAANHLYIKATAPVGLLESVFKTSLANFSVPSGLQFFANTTNLTLPAGLANDVTGVVGLDNVAVEQSQLQRGTRTQAAPAKAAPNTGPIGQDGGTTPCPAAVAGAGYTSPQLASAYDFNGLYKKGLLGQGMSVALVEFDDYHDTNVAGVESCFGVDTPLSRILVDGGTGGPPAAGELEDMADIGVLLEMLPKLAHMYVYVAPNSTVGALDLYNDFAVNRTADVLSSSWGNCEEAESAAENRLFADIAEESAAQGQQIFESAGDSGAVDCRGYPAPTGGSISVEEETGVPWITGVGGTDLGMNTANGISPTRDEDTWNDDGAGGGGVSTLWPMPFWQHRLASARKAPGHSGALCGAAKGQLCREVPDISANADSGEGMQGSSFQFKNDVGSVGYAVYCATMNCALLDELGLPIPVLPIGAGGVGDWLPVGGTSLSTPLTASAAVLWDQLAKRKHLSGLGLINPSLYAVAANHKLYKRDFHDITTDSNDDQYDSSDCPTGCNTHHLYQAGKGYDMATGLGSYDAAKLGASMVKQSAHVSLTPSRAVVYGYTHGVSTSSPVVVSSAYRHAKYTATTSQRWLDVKPGSAPGKLRWSVNPKGLKPGNYTGSIAVRSSGHHAKLSVHYSVSKPAKIQVSTKHLHFAEKAVDDNDKPTSPTCGSTLWNDELYDAVNDSTGTKVDKSTKQILRIGNAGPAGSVLHWQALPVQQVGGWLNTDLTRGKLRTKPSRALVPTDGTDGAGRASAMHLASIADGNLLGGYPGMDQGTYRGAVQIVDLANPSKVHIVHATMKLGNGKGAPTIAAKVAKHLTVKRGHKATLSLKLSDSSHTCGYAYSASSPQSWATPNAADFSGVVPATGSGSAGGSGTGAGTGTVPFTISAKHLSPGVHQLTIDIESQIANPGYKKVHVKVHVQK